MNMQVKTLNTREYSELAGLSFRSGIISRRLRKFELGGALKEMPEGVISVKRIGREWALQVLVSWIESKGGLGE